MTETIIFAYKRFWPLNISDFNVIFLQKLPPPPWKKSPPLSSQPPSKSQVPSFFENLVGGLTPCLQQKEEGVHTMSLKLMGPKLVYQHQNWLSPCVWRDLYLCYMRKAFWLNDLLVLNLKMSTAKVRNWSLIWKSKRLYLCYKI